MADEKEQSKEDVSLSGPEISSIDGEELIDILSEDAAEQPEEQSETEEGEPQDLETENAQLKDRLMRALADAENQRKRGERDRRDAEIYGGRSGTLGAWRLTRAVITHLAATGAVAVGDDLLGSALGGGVLSKLSRRFGEGLINGALTARVGITAMDLCRPLPFDAEPRPKVTSTVRRALAGLVTRDKDD